MVSKQPSEVAHDIEVIKEWMKKQPHLPVIEDRFVRRFLHSCYYSLEKTKRCIELFFSLRAECPEILDERDPMSKEMQEHMKYLNLAYIPYNKNSTVLIWQLNDPGMEHFNYLTDAKLFFLGSDSFMLDEEKLEDEVFVVLDVKDASMKFLATVNMSIAKKLMQYQQEAFPIRLKGIHLVNCPSIIEKIYSLMKPFINKEVAEMIHFHPTKSESLYKYLNKDELPSDYGGKAPSMVELMKNTKKRIEDHRDFFLKEDVWKADKSKMSETKKQKDATSTMKGSFRTLAID